MSDPSPIVLLSGTELERANVIYDELAFARSREGADRTFGLEASGRLVALGRIQDQQGALELGGFWVAETARGRGLARRMVDHVLAQLAPGELAWCIPFEHLISFYEGFGMLPARPEDAPPGIQAKLGFCRERHARGDYVSGTGLLRYSRPG